MTLFSVLLLATLGAPPTAQPELDLRVAVEEGVPAKAKSVLIDARKELRACFTAPAAFHARFVLYTDGGVARVRFSSQRSRYGFGLVRVSRPVVGEVANACVTKVLLGLTFPKDTAPFDFDFDTTQSSAVEPAELGGPPEFATVRIERKNSAYLDAKLQKRYPSRYHEWVLDLSRVLGGCYEEALHVSPQLEGFVAVDLTVAIGPEEGFAGEDGLGDGIFEQVKVEGLDPSLTACFVGALDGHRIDVAPDSEVRLHLVLELFGTSRGT